MPYDPRFNHRRTIRLKGYDYTRPGSYFVTIVTKNREHIFGEISAGEIRLNEWGEIARAEWLKTAVIRREIELDEFVIMPNHIHAIVTIVECDGGMDETVESRQTDVGADGMDVGAHGMDVRAHGMDVRATRRVAPTLVARSIGAIMAQYKSITTKRINQSRGTPGAPVWQRNYWERIIRNRDELSRIREYIQRNPAAWENDDENDAVAGWMERSDRGVWM